MNPSIQFKKSTRHSLCHWYLAAVGRTWRTRLGETFRLPGIFTSSLLVLIAAGGTSQAQQAQNNSELGLRPRTFQALDGQNVLVLRSDSNLWLEKGPFGKARAKTQQVDGKVWTFQGVNINNVFVLGSDGNLWLEHAPFDKVPPKRDQVDGNVWTFQALDTQNVVVLGSDGKLWLVQTPFGSLPPSHRTPIDANVKAFQALDSGDILVLGMDKNLWLEHAPFGNVPPKRELVDGNAFSFQGNRLYSSIFVLGTDGNLWLEQPPFGKVPPKRQQIDGDVKAFQATPILDFVWVQGTDGKLWLEQGPFGKVPPSRQQVDANVRFFQSLDIQHVLVLNTDATLWVVQAPWKVPFPNRLIVDKNVQVSPIPGGPYRQPCQLTGSNNILGTGFVSVPMLGLGTIPYGCFTPFRQSCTAISYNGSALTASCPDYFGNNVKTTLSYADTCTGVINNMNGQLRCVQSVNQVGSGDHAFWEVISLSTWNDAKGTHRYWAIDDPNVTKAETAYRDIRFQPGDMVGINAGGCVQTGGMGATWKSYIDPQGANSGVWYSGTIFIPSIIPPGANGYPRIGGFLKKTRQVPQNLPPTITKDLFVSLGYQDESNNAYGDNGYYSHDDGTSDQCKGVGPAWVHIEVTTPPRPTTTPTATPVGSWGPPRPTPAPGAKPFDETWDLNNEDMNALPFNPYWAYQLQHSDPTNAYGVTIPDFKSICGPAFPNDETIDTGKLRSICTTQSPTSDLSNSDVKGWGIPGQQGYCSGDPLAGHLEWLVSTFTGDLAWDDYSGWLTLNDDDFNFTLAPTGDAGLATANGDLLGLEFRADESINNFSSPFWTNVRDYGKNGNSRIYNLVGDPKEALYKRFAVVTGLLGIDAVHDGKAELHPVYSMAILSSVTPKNGGIDETWEIFLVNEGVGGGCSTNVEHQWMGNSDGTTGNKAWYFISLPMPAGATTSSPVSHDVRGPSAGTFVEDQFESWVYLGFLLPTPFCLGQPSHGDPSAGVCYYGGLDGSVTIHFNVSSDWRAPKIGPDAVVRRAAAVLHEPVKEGVSWNDVMQKMDPKIRQKLEQVRPPLTTVRAPSSPHTVQLTLDSSPATAEKVRALIVQARKRPPQRARVAPNPSLQGQIKKVEQTIQGIAIGSLRLIKEGTPQPVAKPTLPPLRPIREGTPQALATNTAQQALPTGPTATGDQAQPGQLLAVNSPLVSADGRFFFVFQGDANLVLYRKSDGKALWASNTNGQSPGACIIQADGNFVIYDAASKPIWASKTAFPGSRLVVQSDGNVVIYRPSGAAAWATNTVQ